MTDHELQSLKNLSLNMFIEPVKLIGLCGTHIGEHVLIDLQNLNYLVQSKQE